MMGTQKYELEFDITYLLILLKCSDSLIRLNKNTFIVGVYGRKNQDIV